MAGGPEMVESTLSIQTDNNEGVVDEWIRCRTANHKVRSLSPAAALMSFGKTLIYICHSPPRC